jgi:hypothetical protein
MTDTFRRIPHYGVGLKPTAPLDHQQDHDECEPCQPRLSWHERDLAKDDGRQALHDRRCRPLRRNAPYT